MDVMEELERLLTNARVRGGIDEHHAKQHDMSRDAARLCVVELHSSLAADLSTLDIEEAVHRLSVSCPDAAGESGAGVLDIVRADVKTSPEQHAVGNVSMKILSLVQRQETQSGTDKGHEITAHGEEDDSAIDGETEGSAA